MPDCLLLSCGPHNHRRIRPPLILVVCGLSIPTIIRKRYVLYSLCVLLKWRCEGALTGTSFPDRSNGTTIPTEIPASETTSKVVDVDAYVSAIMHPEFQTHLEKLECPAPLLDRYEHLRTGSPTTRAFRGARPKLRYLFALDLREVVDLLPQLLGSVVAVARYLGPDRCALSIVEGNSRDGTAAVLRALEDPLIRELGLAAYFFQQSALDPSTGSRIEKLAILRQLAVQPMLDDARRWERQSDKMEGATVIFLNDVAACPDDILELVHQRKVLGAQVVCGMDFTFVGQDPTFYDVWVARTLAGDTFFEIPADGSWDSAWNLFWNDPTTKARFNAHRPFQVFSCWNGAAVMSAAPLIKGTVKFRGPTKAECFQGEPELLCKDLWASGNGKIAVVPSVSLEYTVKQARRIKDLKGHTTHWVEEEQNGGDVAKQVSRIDWQKEPPEKVKCMGSYENQTWRAWDEGFT